MSRITQSSSTLTSSISRMLAWAGPGYPRVPRTNDSMGVSSTAVLNRFEVSLPDYKPLREAATDLEGCPPCDISRPTLPPPRHHPAGRRADTDPRRRRAARPHPRLAGPTSLSHSQDHRLHFP